MFCGCKEILLFSPIHYLVNHHHQFNKKNYSKYIPLLANQAQCAL